MLPFTRSISRNHHSAHHFIKQDITFYQNTLYMFLWYAISFTLSNKSLIDCERKQQQSFYIGRLYQELKLSRYNSQRLIHVGRPHFILNCKYNLYKSYWHIYPSTLAGTVVGGGGAGQAVQIRKCRNRCGGDRRSGAARCALPGVVPILPLYSSLAVSGAWYVVKCVVHTLCCPLNSGMHIKCQTQTVERGQNNNVILNNRLCISTLKLSV